MSDFVDYYEVLQISPNADPETLSRVFRHLVKRYHPDNPDTGNREQFDAVYEAHCVLSDPEQRTFYDTRYQTARALHVRLAREASSAEGFHDDQTLRERLLSVLYVQRRQDVYNAALGNVVLEQILSCPREHLEFHIWYLKQKDLVERTDRGVAITALGIDQAMSMKSRADEGRLLAQRAQEDSES